MSVEDPTPLLPDSWDPEAKTRMLDSGQIEGFGTYGIETFTGIIDAFPNYKKGLLESAKAGIASGVLAPVTFDVDSGNESLPVASWRIGTINKGHEQIFIAYRTGDQPQRMSPVSWEATDLPWEQKFEVVRAAANQEVINISFWDPNRDSSKIVNTQAVALGLQQLSDTLGFDIKRHINRMQTPR